MARLGGAAQWFLKRMSALNVGLFRATGGKLGGSMGKARVLLLTTIGRKSGQPRTTPLLYLDDGERLVIVASKGGHDEHPLWYRNLIANPDVEVELGSARRKMRARTASPEERAAYWPRLVAMYGGYAGYQRKTTREIPVVVLEPRAEAG